MIEADFFKTALWETCCPLLILFDELYLKIIWNAKAKYLNSSGLDSTGAEIGSWIIEISDKNSEFKKSWSKKLVLSAYIEIKF